VKQVERVQFLSHIAVNARLQQQQPRKGTRAQKETTMKHNSH